MLDEMAKAGPIALWGAVVATGLAAIKIWETFIRDRLRLVTTYFWTGQTGAPDIVTVVNLTPIPVMASHWELRWEPKFWSWNWGPIDVTPEFDPDDVRSFKIEPHETWTLYIADDNKFNWGRLERDGRRLVLVIHLFGRKKPVRLSVT